MDSHRSRHAGSRGHLRGVVIAAGLLAPVLLAPAVARADDPVVVNITGPIKAKLGQKIVYDVELINVSGRNLEKLWVVDTFDEGFHHAVSGSPIELKQTIDLPAGTKTTLKLEFELDGVGRQCHRVEILDQARKFMGGATDCCLVEAPPQQPAAAPDQGRTPPPVLVPPPVTAPASTPIAPLTSPAAAQPRLDFVGPAEAVAGTEGTYRATVRNLGTAATPPGTLKLAWEDGLLPTQASGGAAMVGSSVSWPLPAIEPGRAEERQLVLQARAPANVYRDDPPLPTRVNAELAFGAGIVAAERQAVAIRSTTPRPRPRSFADADIRLSLADLDDPVRVGDSTTLVCTIVNAGTLSSGPIDVVIDLPRDARPAGNSRVRLENNRAMFDAIDVPPGGQRTVEIAYQVRTPGRYTAAAQATANVTNAAGTAPLTGDLRSSCETEFLPR